MDRGNAGMLVVTISAQPVRFKVRTDDVGRKPSLKRELTCEARVGASCLCEVKSAQQTWCNSLEQFACWQVLIFLEFERIEFRWVSRQPPV